MRQQVVTQLLHSGTRRRSIGVAVRRDADRKRGERRTVVRVTKRRRIERRGVLPAAVGPLQLPHAIERLTRDRIEVSSRLGVIDRENAGQDQRVRNGRSG